MDSSPAGGGLLLLPSQLLLPMSSSYSGAAVPAAASTATSGTGQALQLLPLQLQRQEQQQQLQQQQQQQQAHERNLEFSAGILAAEGSLGGCGVGQAQQLLPPPSHQQQELQQQQEHALQRNLELGAGILAAEGSQGGSVLEQVLRRAKADGCGRDTCELLKKHFAALPFRYSQSVDPRRYDDVLLHVRLLNEARETNQQLPHQQVPRQQQTSVEGGGPVVSVRRVWLGGGADSQEPHGGMQLGATDVAQPGMGGAKARGLNSVRKYPKPTFGSNLNLAGSCMTLSSASISDIGGSWLNLGEPGANLPPIPRPPGLSRGSAGNGSFKNNNHNSSNHMIDSSNTGDTPNKAASAAAAAGEGGHSQQQLFSLDLVSPKKSGDWGFPPVSGGLACALQAATAAAPATTTPLQIGPRRGSKASLRASPRLPPHQEQGDGEGRPVGGGGRGAVESPHSHESSPFGCELERDDSTSSSREGDAPGRGSLAVASAGAAGGAAGMTAAATAVPELGWEVTVAAPSRPGSLTCFSDALSDSALDLHIREAHVFSTTDNMLLQVFVVTSTRANDETEEVQEQVRQILHEKWAKSAPASKSIEHSQMENLRAAVDAMAYEDWAVDYDDLSIHEKLGDGSSGRLYRGVYRGQDVAVKVISLNPRENAGGGDDTSSISMRLGVGMDGGGGCGGAENTGVSDTMAGGTVSAQELLTCFKREVSIMRIIRHKNVVQFIGACSHWPRLYIVTELMARGSVRDVLDQRGCGIPPTLALKIFRDVARGLDFLHRRGIVHRDLKAANLLVDENDVVKVCDFGVARLVPLPPNASSPKAAANTANAAMQGAPLAAEWRPDLTAETGTYRWMAPEVLNHEPYGFKADVYSFGITMWEVLCGEIPYAGMTPLQAAVGVLQRNLRPRLPSTVPPQLASLVERCWDADATARPTFSQILSILDGLSWTLGDGHVSGHGIGGVGSNSFSGVGSPNSHHHYHVVESHSPSNGGGLAALWKKAFGGRKHK